MSQGRDSLALRAKGKLSRPVRAGVLMLLVSCLSACSSTPKDIDRAGQLAAAGDYEAAVQALREQYQQHPENLIYRGALIRTTNLSVAALSSQAESALNLGQVDQARSLYQRALGIDSQNRRALDGLRRIEQAQRQQQWLLQAEAALEQDDRAAASQYVRQILSENPSHERAQAIRRQVREHSQMAQLRPEIKSPELNQLVSLELRDTGLKDALMLLSQSARLNFILDQDVEPDTPVTLFVTEARIEDVLEFIFQTYALEKKVLNARTLLIYPANSDKKARYADLYTRTFHASHAAPARLADLLRSVLQPADMHIDEISRSLVIRDTPEVLEAAERLIELHDTAPAEVLLDVEILEVSTDVMSNLGIEYPGSISVSVEGQAATPGVLRWSELGDINSDSFTLGVGDPLAVFNLRNTIGSGNILAKPQIRVKNREQADILIGDKVPVITSTLNQTSGFESQSVTYLDVGIKLEVEPEIFPGNEVSMKVMLEVSNIAREIVGDSGLRAYQVGTRTANTTLQLRDGETQVLAGLIKNEEINSQSRVPGLGAIPGLGRLFTNDNKSHVQSELVLLITPRIVRNVLLPDAYASTFYTGTKDRLALTPPALGSQASFLQERPEPAVAVKASSVAADSSSPVTAERRMPSSESGGPTALRLPGPMAVAEPPNSVLSLVGPGAIDGGQPFNVILALDASDQTISRFSLEFDETLVELQSVTPAIAAEDLAYQLHEGRIDFTLLPSGLVRSNNVLATISLQTRDTNQQHNTQLIVSAEAAPGQDSGMIMTQHGLQIFPAPFDDMVLEEDAYAEDLAL